MAISTDMTWQADRTRWRKIYRGKLYLVSCSDLGTEATKLGSYQAANAWWQAKRAEVESGSPAKPMHRTIEKLERRKAWAEQHGEAEIARSIGASIEIAKEADMDDPALFHETEVAGHVWQDRLSRAGKQASSDKTIGHHTDKFLALERARVDSDQISVAEFDSVRRCLFAFRDWCGASTEIHDLDSDRLESYFLSLLSQPISVEYKKRKLRIAKSFIFWLAEKGTIPVPPNVRSRKLRFKSGGISIPVIPDEEVQRLVSEAPGQLKLHLVLMLNCGFTQMDISDLKPTEIDWKRGRIKRKRSKTADHDAVPIVDYPLWSLTWELLQKYGHRDGENALTTLTGKTWVRDSLSQEGKRRKTDAIKSNYMHLMKKTGTHYPMKLFRKTGATRLETHEVYGRYAPMFLGHAPKSIAEKHYASLSADILDKAVRWLGEEFGF